MIYVLESRKSTTLYVIFFKHFGELFFHQSITKGIRVYLCRATLVTYFNIKINIRNDIQANPSSVLRMLPPLEINFSGCLPIFFLTLSLHISCFKSPFDCSVYNYSGMFTKDSFFPIFHRIGILFLQE